MSASITRSHTYRITSAGCELPRGTKFGVKRVPIREGQLALFQVGRFLIIGRMFENFIVQPSRWIDCSTATVRIVGLIA